MFAKATACGRVAAYLSLGRYLPFELEAMICDELVGNGKRAFYALS